MSKNTLKSHSAAPALNENGVSAKKAESSLAASCNNGNVDFGQSCSVPVGQKDVCAPQFEPDQLRDSKQSETAPVQSDEVKSDDDKSNVDKSNEVKSPIMDLGVAAGLALLAVEQAGKVIHDASKNWEDRVDAVAQRAHETIELAQRAIKHPVGETMTQVDHLAHSKEKNSKKAS